jgi:hypothetical protein
MITLEQFQKSRMTLFNKDGSAYFDYMDGKVKIGIDGGLYYYDRRRQFSRVHRA